MTLSGDYRAFTSVRFSPDGKTIAAGDFDYTIKLWESAVPADGYGPRRTSEDGREIVNQLYQKHGFYYDVIEKLQGDKALDEPVRQLEEAKAALEQLRELCKDEQYSEDIEVQDLLAEAEKLLAGEKR